MIIVRRAYSKEVGIGCSWVTRRLGHIFGNSLLFEASEILVIYYLSSSDRKKNDEMILRLIHAIKSCRLAAVRSCPLSKIFTSPPTAVKFFFRL
mmetsp:Transcript_5413/g.9786  ORF Transcript_5413/g.9786 Transcript_5413/m.9786 type:complete len:94 (+) Transcript_5413:1313-1594(+)